MAAEGGAKGRREGRSVGVAVHSAHSGSRHAHRRRCLAACSLALASKWLTASASLGARRGRLTRQAVAHHGVDLCKALGLNLLVLHQAEQRPSANRRGGLMACAAEVPQWAAGQ